MWWQGSPENLGVSQANCLKNVWLDIAEYVLFNTALFRRCARDRYFSRQWKVPNVAVLRKSQDKVASNPSSVYFQNLEKYWKE